MKEERSLKEMFNSEHCYNKFVEFFNSLDVFYIDELKGFVLSNRLDNNGSESYPRWFKYLKDNNYIQHAGKYKSNVPTDGANGRRGYTGTKAIIRHKSIKIKNII